MAEAIFGIMGSKSLLHLFLYNYNYYLNVEGGL